MKSIFICLLLEFGVIANVQAQAYLLVGTKTTLTVSISKYPVLYWNDEKSTLSELVYDRETTNKGSQYFEIVQGKRVGKLIIYPFVSYPETTRIGLYQHLSTGKSYNLVSYAPSDLAGRWNVNMTCSSSSCPETKPNQVRNEIWRINTERPGQVSVTVSDNDGQTISKYKGEFDGIYLNLTAVVDGFWSVKAKAEVSLRLINRRLTGGRQVTRKDPCLILSTVTATKL